jgi:hypothetical protein
MAAVTVYRYTDVGAPQVADGKPSEYMAVIKKCLVDGYGTKTPLGWSIAEDDHLGIVPRLALTNSLVNGSGGTIVFSATDNNAGTFTKFIACQSYIDKDNLIQPSNYFGMHRYSTLTNLNKNWMLIGTDTGFYFFATNDTKAVANYLSNTVPIFLFAGDINSYIANDQNTFTCLGGAPNSTSTSYQNNLVHKLTYSNSGHSLLKLYRADGSGLSDIGSLSSIFGTNWYSSLTSEYDLTPEITMLTKVYLQKGIPNSITQIETTDINNPLVRGEMPGMYLSPIGGRKNTSIPDIVNVNSVPHFHLPSSKTYCSLVYINMENWP